MPTYEPSGFSPPAPVVRVRLLRPRGSRDDVPLLIDSGADVSVLPLASAHAVGAETTLSNVAIRLFSGDEVNYVQAQLGIEFLRYRFQGLFLLADTSYGVLGRNILNRLLLTLDGPRLVWSL